MAFGALGLVLAASHVPFVMVTSWADPQGWPWDLYRGKIDEESYLLAAPGFAALQRLEALDPGWPRVWYTGTELTGRIRAIPLAAAAWEFQIHGAKDRATILEHIEKASCDYWVVQADSKFAEQFRAAGVADEYWTPENLVESEGALEIYRMPSSRRAAALVKARPLPPLSDLLVNGGFEEGDGVTARSWLVISGRARWLSSSEDAREGAGSIEVARDGVVVQQVTLRDGVRTLRLTQWVCSTEPGKTVSVRLQVNWSDSGGRFLSGSVVVVGATDAWKEYRMTARVPPRAAIAVVYLNSQGGSGAARFDGVHLYAAE